MSYTYKFMVILNVSSDKNEEVKKAVSISLSRMLDNVSFVSQKDEILEDVILISEEENKNKS